MLMPLPWEEPIRSTTNPSSTQKMFSEETRPRPEHSRQEGYGSAKLLDSRPVEPEWDSDAGVEPERSPSGARTEQRTPKVARGSERTLESSSGARAEPDWSSNGAKDSERSTGPRKDARGPDTTLFRDRRISHHSWETQCSSISSDSYLSSPKPGQTTGGSGRGARRGGGQDWMPTELFAQGTSLPRTPQSIGDTSPERLPRSTNKRNSM